MFISEIITVITAAGVLLEIGWCRDLVMTKSLFPLYLGGDALRLIITSTPGSGPIILHHLLASILIGLSPHLELSHFLFGCQEATTLLLPYVKKHPHGNLARLFGLVWLITRVLMPLFIPFVHSFDTGLLARSQSVIVSLLYGLNINWTFKLLKYSGWQWWPLALASLIAMTRCPAIISSLLILMAISIARAFIMGQKMTPPECLGIQSQIRR